MTPGASSFLLITTMILTSTTLCCAPLAWNVFLATHFPALTQPGLEDTHSSYVSYSLRVLTSHPKCIECFVFLCLDVHSSTIATVTLNCSIGEWHSHIFCFLQQKLELQFLISLTSHIQWSATFCQCQFLFHNFPCKTTLYDLAPGYFSHCNLHLSSSCLLYSSFSGFLFLKLARQTLDSEPLQLLFHLPKTLFS